MKIIIVNYGLGNLESVYNAFKTVGADVKVSDSPTAIGVADKLVLPGVGAFQDAVKELKERELFEPIRAFIKSGKPYLGICLGQQLLFESSDEGQGTGLSVFRGSVKKFRTGQGLKVPHMGWNTVEIDRDELGVMKGVTKGAYFYFVHSYYVEPADDSVKAGSTTYGSTCFTSVVQSGNVFATQFHPEKSQAEGLKIIKNFAGL